MVMFTAMHYVGWAGCLLKIGSRAAKQMMLFMCHFFSFQLVQHWTAAMRAHVSSACIGKTQIPCIMCLSSRISLSRVQTYWTIKSSAPKDMSSKKMVQRYSLMHECDKVAHSYGTKLHNISCLKAFYILR